MTYCSVSLTMTNMTFWWNDVSLMQMQTRWQNICIPTLSFNPQSNNILYYFTSCKMHISAIIYQHALTLTKFLKANPPPFFLLSLQKCIFVQSTFSTWWWRICDDMAVVLRQLLKKFGVSECLWRTGSLKSTERQAGEEKLNHITTLDHILALSWRATHTEQPCECPFPKQWPAVQASFGEISQVWHLHHFDLISFHCYIKELLR